MRRIRAALFVALLVTGSVTAWVLNADTARASGDERPQAAAPQGPGATGVAAPAAAGARASIRLDRAPVRVIESRHAAFVAVAVDAKRDELVVQDENRFNIQVYDRTANTPPKASMTEPKRVIGGANTLLGKSNCGLYLDPLNGDIYSVSNDVTNFMTVFAREVEGNVPPTRKLATPHRTFGVAVDEQAQELFLTIQHPAAVVVWRKFATENEVPLRAIEGPKTRLADVHGIAVDSKNQVLYVSNRGAGSYVRPAKGFLSLFGKGTWNPPGYEDYRDTFYPGTGFFTEPSITAFPLKANGDTAPLRVIQGPKTRLNWPAHIHLDVARQEIFVTETISHAILVFRAIDSGDVAPIRVIEGNQTKLAHPHGVFVDADNQELVVANFGNHSTTVYPVTASGNATPIRVIRSAPEGTRYPMIGKVGALAYDSRRDQILAPN